MENTFIFLVRNLKAQPSNMRIVSAEPFFFMSLQRCSIGFRYSFRLVDSRNFTVFLIRRCDFLALHTGLIFIPAWDPENIFYTELLCSFLHSSFLWLVSQPLLKKSITTKGLCHHHLWLWDDIKEVMPMPLRDMIKYINLCFFRLETFASQGPRVISVPFGKSPMGFHSCRNILCLGTSVKAWMVESCINGHSVRFPYFPYFPEDL